MNSFTDKSDFMMSAEFILENSEILDRDECVILDNVLYERLKDQSEHKYRFFFSTDDYDYLENALVSAQLDVMFS